MMLYLIPMVLALPQAALAVFIARTRDALIHRGSIEGIVDPKACPPSEYSRVLMGLGFMLERLLTSLALFLFAFTLVLMFVDNATLGVSLLVALIAALDLDLLVYYREITSRRSSRDQRH